MSEQPKKQIVTPTIKFASYSSSFLGPIPPPEVLRGYQDVLPGSAERIIALAEREQTQRHKLERAESDNRWRLAIFGQFMAFTLALIGMGGGLVLVWLDKSIAGFPMFFTTLGGLVGVYVYYHHSIKSAGIKELSQPPSRPSAEPQG